MQRTKKPCMSWSTEYFSCIQTVLLPWDRPSVCCCVSDRGRYEDHTSAAYFQIVSSATVKTQTYRIYHSRQIHRRRICTCSGVGSVHKFRSGVIYCSTLSLILICWLCKKTPWPCSISLYHCRNWRFYTEFQHFWTSTVHESLKFFGGFVSLSYFFNSQIYCWSNMLVAIT